jgi:predicted nucleotidyltransferase
MSPRDNLSAFSPKIQLPWLQAGIQRAIKAYLTRLIAGHGHEVLSVTLYGSQARGEAETESDIDLFIVIDRELPALRQALIDLAWEVQFEHNVVISDIICPLDQFQQLQINRFPFYQNIEKEGVILWKNPSVPTPAFA